MFKSTGDGNRPERKLVIYTDGGCSGNPGPGGWAYVILGPSQEGAAEAALEPRAEGSGGESATTNNRMELLAVISALKKAESLLDKNDPAAKITVYTDSQYVQKGITQWIENWKRNAWKTSGKQPVKNRDLWLKLDSAAAKLPLDWRWVRGHAGDEYNERCDAMVHDAMRDLLK